MPPERTHSRMDDYPTDDEQARRARRQEARLRVRRSIPDDEEPSSAEQHLLAALGDYGRRGEIHTAADEPGWAVGRYPLAEHYGVEAEAAVVRHVEGTYPDPDDDGDEDDGGIFSGSGLL